MQHRSRVSDSARHTDYTSDERERRAFEQEQLPHLLRCEAEREQCADFLRPLLNSKREQQSNQNQCREDQEKTKPDEQSTEVLRLLGGAQRLFAHRLKLKP